MGMRMKAEFHALMPEFYGQRKRITLYIGDGYAIISLGLTRPFQARTKGLDGALPSIHKFRIASERKADRRWLPIDFLS